VKLKYRNKQLKHILSNLDNSTKVRSQLLKEISVLDVIYWISAAWKELDSSTIVKCSQKAGFKMDKDRSLTQSHVSDDGDVGVAESDEENDVEDDVPIAVLSLSRELFGCDFKELVAIDKHTETCDSITRDWDNTPALDILQEIRASQESACDDVVDCYDGDDGDIDDDSEDTDSKKLTSNDIQECINKIKHYSLMNGYH